MKELLKYLLWVWLAATFLPSRAASSREPVSAKLGQLAAQSSQAASWPALQRFAATTKDPEQRGLALLLVGYRQFEAGLFLNASDTLRGAAATRFSLADFAEYYRGVAAANASQWKDAIESLEGFVARHPQSSWRQRVPELLARAYLESGVPERAIEALTAEPHAGQIPAAKLLLAQSYIKAQKFTEAAQVFEEVYYAFPLAAESSTAWDALRQLEVQLGGAFPAAPEEIRAARAQILFNRAQYSKAQVEYDALLAARPASPLADRWKLARARCLLNLKQNVQAVEALEALVSTNPEIDAQRLAALVDADTRLDDAELMLRELEQLRQLYPASPVYAAGLARVASFFARKADHENALRYDQILAEKFPTSDLGRDADWHIAWDAYLSRQGDKARQAFLEHLARYPVSPHVSAAVYWLGRLAEDEKDFSGARAAFTFVSRYFVQSYYGVLARERLPAPPAGSSKGATPSTLAATIAGLERNIAGQQKPAARFSALPCAGRAATTALRPCLTLQALGLDDLAEEYLKAELAEHPGAPDLLLVFSRLKLQKHEYSAALESAKQLVPNAAEHRFPDLAEELWDLLYPQAFRKLVEQQARADRLDPNLVMALIRQESEFNPDATSWADARGLMQILPTTVSSTRAGRAAAARQLYDPAYNVRFGCRYLRDLLQSLDGRRERAMAAYHAGLPNVRTWLEGRDYREPGEFVEAIPIPTTRAYVEAVLRDAEIYRQLRGHSVKFKKCG